jgi:hypothetical protein
MESRTGRSLRAALLAAALAAAMPAGAQTYKWVDERGGVTYSNTPPPADGKKAKKFDAVAERVSVYTPDSQLIEAMKADPARDAKVAGLERELKATKQSNAEAAKEARRDAAYERCVSQRRVDCESLRSGSPAAVEPALPPDYATLYYPHVVGTAHFPRRTRPFVVIEEPVPIGIDNRPKVGIDNRPKVGIDSRPPVGAPPRNRTSASYR